MVPSGEWFIIRDGPDKGKIHLSGWMLTAIKTETLGALDDGWRGLAICPLCSATVFDETSNPGLGNFQWSHEQWHAITDYPIPLELLADPLYKNRIALDEN
jgi:hypothetical protein